MTVETQSEFRQRIYNGEGAVWATAFVQKCAIEVLRMGMPAELIVPEMLEQWYQLWLRIDAQSWARQPGGQQKKET